MDGTLGCATPCVFCQRELLRFDLRVHCSQAGQSWFSGRLDEAGAPESKPTTGQRRLLLGHTGNTHAHKSEHLPKPGCNEPSARRARARHTSSLGSSHMVLAPGCEGQRQKRVPKAL
jgi:hypothetical protein